MQVQSNHAESAIFFIGGVGESRLDTEPSVSTFRFEPTSFDGDGEPIFIESSGRAKLARAGDRVHSGV